LEETMRLVVLCSLNVKRRKEEDARLQHLMIQGI